MHVGNKILTGDNSILTSIHEVYQVCSEQDIFLYFPSNLTHITQLLDVVFFSKRNIYIYTYKISVLPFLILLL